MPDAKLIRFAAWIKRNYSLGVYYGGMISSEYCECNPSAEWLVEKFEAYEDSDAE